MLNKALCETVTATIWRCELLTNTLANHGFKSNPCGLCVANAALDNKQYTIIYHAYYTKASHVEQEIEQSVFKMLQSIFGKM